MEGNLPLRAGTVGGTFLIVLLQISSGKIVETGVLAVVGAVVSFGVSLLLRRLTRRMGKK